MKSFGAFLRGGRAALVLFALQFVGVHAQAQSDPLPSWNDGPAKKAIVEFVARVTWRQRQERPEASMGRLI